MESAVEGGLHAAFTASAVLAAERGRRAGAAAAPAESTDAAQDGQVRVDPAILLRRARLHLAERGREGPFRNDSPKSLRTLVAVPRGDLVAFNRTGDHTTRRFFATYRARGLAQEPTGARTRPRVQLPSGGCGVSRRDATDSVLGFVRPPDCSREMAFATPRVEVRPMVQQASGDPVVDALLSVVCRLSCRFSYFRTSLKPQRTGSRCNTNQYEKGGHILHLHDICFTFVAPIFTARVMDEKSAYFALPQMPTTVLCHRVSTSVRSVSWGVSALCHPILMSIEMCAGVDARFASQHSDCAHRSKGTFR